MPDESCAESKDMYDIKDLPDLKYYKVFEQTKVLVAPIDTIITFTYTIPKFKLVYLKKVSIVAALTAASERARFVAIRVDGQQLNTAFWEFEYGIPATPLTQYLQDSFEFAGAPASLSDIFSIPARESIEIDMSYQNVAKNVTVTLWALLHNDPSAFYQDAATVLGGDVGTRVDRTIDIVEQTYKQAPPPELVVINV